MDWSHNETKYTEMEDSNKEVVRKIRKEEERQTKKRWNNEIDEVKDKYWLQKHKTKNGTG